MTAPSRLVGSITDVAGVRVGHHQRIGRGLADRHDGGVRARRGHARRRRARRRAGHPGDRCPRAREPGRAHPRDLPHRRQRVRAGRGRRGDGLARGSARLGFPVGPPMPAPPRVVPVVPAAVIFDLGRGGVFEQSARRQLRRAGCSRAPARPSDRGPSAPAPAPGPAGCRAASAPPAPSSRSPGDDDAPSIRRSIVGALAVVNATGSVIDPATGLPVGAAAGRSRRPTAASATCCWPARRPAPPARPGVDAPRDHRPPEHDDRRRRHVGPH